MKHLAFMMSVLFFLMLGCSTQCGYAICDDNCFKEAYASKSSHSQDFDTVTTDISSDTLTRQLTSSTSTISSQDDSLLFASVYKYTSQVSKRSYTEKQIIVKTIINEALENDIDICFIIAQGKIETHLGTTGIGKTRKSIFGIYRTYSSYERCVKDYIRILKRYYLVRGRTEHHLMKRYANISGHRYAGDKGYERRLRKAYTEIVKTTNIYELQMRFKTNNEC